MLVVNVPGLGAGALCGEPCAVGQSPGSLARVTTRFVLIVMESAFCY